MGTILSKRIDRPPGPAASSGEPKPPPTSAEQRKSRGTDLKPAGGTTPISQGAPGHTQASTTTTTTTTQGVSPLRESDADVLLPTPPGSPRLSLQGNAAALTLPQSVTDGSKPASSLSTARPSTPRRAGNPITTACNNSVPAARQLDVPRGGSTLTAFKHRGKLAVRLPHSLKAGEVISFQYDQKSFLFIVSEHHPAATVLPVCDTFKNWRGAAQAGDEFAKAQQACFPAHDPSPPQPGPPSGADVDAFLRPKTRKPNMSPVALRNLKHAAWQAEGSGSRMGPAAAFPRGTLITHSAAAGAEHTLLEIASSTGSRFFVSGARAHGRFGIVRYAVDQFGEPWAVKQFRTDSSKRNRVERQLQDKEKAIKRSTHTEILHEVLVQAFSGGDFVFHDIMTIGEEVYGVMPLMHGALDSHYLVELANKSAEIRQHFGRLVLDSLASTLSKIHKQGFAHCDVKPENIFVDEHGGFVLGDFGLASRDGESRSFQGTANFVAPEIVEHGKVRCSSDTWSLGITMAALHQPRRQQDVKAPVNPFGADASVGLGSGHFLQQLVTARKEFGAWRKKGIAACENNAAALQEYIQGSRVGADPFSDFFRELAHVDPELCLFVVRDMLHPNPIGRPSPEQITKFLGGNDRASDGRRPKQEVQLPLADLKRKPPTDVLRSLDQLRSRVLSAKGTEGPKGQKGPKGR